DEKDAGQHPQVPVHLLDREPRPSQRRLRRHEDPHDDGGREQQVGDEPCRAGGVPRGGAHAATRSETPGQARVTTTRPSRPTNRPPRGTPRGRGPPARAPASGARPAAGQVPGATEPSPRGEREADPAAGAFRWWSSPPPRRHRRTPVLLVARPPRLRRI